MLEDTLNGWSELKMLQRTDSIYPYQSEQGGWGSAVPFTQGNGSYNSDDQARLTEFNAHWYSYSHKYYQDWELTFRSIMDFRADNAYANYSMLGSYEDMSRFFWTGMMKDEKDEFLNKVYFGEYYKDLEAFEDEWDLSNSYKERSPSEE
jgi:hypothetical protein